MFELSLEFDLVAGLILRFALDLDADKLSLSKHIDVRRSLHTEVNESTLAFVNSDKAPYVVAPEKEPFDLQPFDDGRLYLMLADLVATHRILRNGPVARESRESCGA
jgi:hypothetical protein